MKKKIILIPAIALFLFSCGNASNEKSEDLSEIETHDEHHHDHESEAIELNNGEKWTVDANMLTHIRTMENDVISFAKVEQKDYKVLSEKLQASIDLLTSNCTMTGQAHDELHKWLLPYMDLVEELSEAINEAEALQQFENIQTSFTTFNQYFQ
mgnify:FL=1